MVKINGLSNVVQFITLIKYIKIKIIGIRFSIFTIYYIVNINSLIKIHNKLYFFI